jgi:hypothetical protein
VGRPTTTWSLPLSPSSSTSASSCLPLKFGMKVSFTHSALTISAGQICENLTFNRQNIVSIKIAVDLTVLGKLLFPYHRFLWHVFLGYFVSFLHYFVWTIYLLSVFICKKNTDYMWCKQFFLYFSLCQKL